MADDVSIKISDLSVNFDRWGQSVSALTDINLDIPEEQLVIIIGSNGSGKSTLLKAIYGLVEYSSGKITLAKHSNDKFSSDLFYISQDPLAGTAEELTLLENLQVATPTDGGFFSSYRLDKNGLTSLMKTFDLVSRKDQLLKDFSGGERQQIALLIASLRKPRVLLLDEPLSALHPEKIEPCMNLINTMSQDGSTILMVTHSPDIAYSYGDRTIELDEGHIICDKAGLDRGCEKREV